MRTTGFSSTRRFARPRRAAKPRPQRFVGVGDKEHYDTSSPQDYREYLAVRRLSAR